MQKKLIALAVAGLVSAPAFAQSNVTIYGVVDMGYSYSSKSDTDTYKSRSGLDSGLQSGSRIGFRGTEDLGNGLKAGFVLENSIGADTGTGPSMTRQSFLSLSGGFGTVAVGRQYSPQYNFVSELDPFGTGTVGDLVYGRGVYVVGASDKPETIRLNNLVAYVSPNFSGLTVTAGYTANALADEEETLRGNKSGNAKIWAINPVYKNGPLMVGANYHQVKIDSVADYKDKVWDIGGSYDFGAVKVAALYGQMKAEDMDEKAKQWMLGATVPVSAAGKVLVSYSRVKIEDEKASKAALGYTHDLSKRTNLYAAYAKISTNDEAEGGFSVYKSDKDFDYTRGVNVGIRHKF